MGNIQFRAGAQSSELPQNNELSLISLSSAPDQESQIDGSSRASSIPQHARTTCEFCQDQIYVELQEQHKSLCLYNPDNLMAYLEVADPSMIDNSQKELEKVACKFCGEQCYVLFHNNHQRVCTKNPENIKINCRYCDRTLNLILYQSHLADCEENSERRRSSVAPNSNSRRGDSSNSRQIGLLGMRKIKTTPEITIDDWRVPKRCPSFVEEKECSICLEDIKSNFEMSTLTCGHKYHRQCIDNWSRRQRKCPICRKEFL